MITLSDGRTVNPEGPLGRRLIRTDTTRVLQCTYCKRTYGPFMHFGRGPWRVSADT